MRDAIDEKVSSSNYRTQYLRFNFGFSFNLNLSSDHHIGTLYEGHVSPRHPFIDNPLVRTIAMELPF